MSFVDTYECPAPEIKGEGHLEVLLTGGHLGHWLRFLYEQAWYLNTVQRGFVRWPAQKYK